LLDVLNLNMIHDLINKRRSTLLFSDKEIESGIIDDLFEAARWAPSSNNIQPWRFVYALKEDAEYDLFLACLSDKNREWAHHAPMLLLTIAEIKNIYINRENIYAWHDTGMAYANLVFQALSVGLSVHPMGGFDREVARRNMQIPSGYEPVIMVAIGYKSDSVNFPIYLLEKEEKPRFRKTIEEIVFRGKFNKGESN
jgi:nitroreductase